jgi:hypothetical protein
MIPTELSTGQVFRAEEAEGLRRLLREAREHLGNLLAAEGGSLAAERFRVRAERWLHDTRPAGPGRVRG